MHIEHNLHGGRTTVSEHNGTRVATNGKNGGYVQKPMAGEKGYFARTTVDHGVAHSAVYRGYSYGGRTYYGYQPAAYYNPGFYGYALGGWGAGIAWDAGAWGWGGAPWLGYYGFNPYPFYAGPAFWLTDYLIAANLQAAYLAAAEGLAGGPGISVIANQPWTDTGIPVSAGQTYTITGAGTIAFNGPGSVATPAGVGGPCNNPGNAPVPNLPCISMTGKIGPGGPPFYVGNSKTFVAPFDGELFLGVNDDYFPDNSGAWIANVIPAGGPAAAAPAGGEVSVDATQPWTDTGMQVVQGQPYRINASGFVTDAGQAIGPAGLGSTGVCAGADPRRLVAFNAPCGGLIGKIGPAGSSFYVGRTRTLTAPVSGELFLGYNDVVGTFGDNSGAWAVNISPVGGSAPDAPQPAGDAAVAPTGSDAVVLTPDVKQAIADEVKAQLQTEKAAAAQGGQQPAPASDEAPPALDPAHRTFVVYTDLAVTGDDGQECSLTQGDVITRLTDSPDADQKVKVSVGGTKKKDCASGKLVAVSVDDLQEMHNHFQQNLDDGMKNLASKQGTGKMPKAGSTSTVASAVQPPPPDSGAVQAIQDQQAAADQTETQVKQETTGGQ